LGEQNEKSETFFLIRFLPNPHYCALKSFIFPNTANKTLKSICYFWWKNLFSKRGWGEEKINIHPVISRKYTYTPVISRKYKYTTVISRKYT